jgi:glycosyltransferase involved in cell wall biosynthesis
MPPYLRRNGHLIISLPFLCRNRATGLQTYAVNVLKHLYLDHLTLLLPQWVDLFPTRSIFPIPDNMSFDEGIKGHFRRLAWTQFKLPRLYRKLGSSLLFSPMPEAPLAAKCRSVVVVHDTIPLRFSCLNYTIKLYFRYYVPRVLAHSEHVICNSLATARDVCYFYGLPARKITPIPLAYDSSHFRPLETTAIDEERADETYFLFIGRHDPYKNVGGLISAFASIKDSGKCLLRIVGPPDPRYTPQLQAQAQVLGVADRVEFMGYVDYQDLPALIRNAVALVIPSLWEGFGLPALEAIACGTPVIASNVASLPEIVGDAAILVNPNDQREIAAAMSDLLKNSHQRAALRVAGLTRAKQFSWHYTGKQTSEVLRKFL